MIRLAFICAMTIMISFDFDPPGHRASSTRLYQKMESAQAFCSEEVGKVMQRWGIGLRSIPRYAPWYEGAYEVGHKGTGVDVSSTSKRHT